MRPRLFAPEVIIADFSLSIIIVNWNARDDLRACLASLRDQVTDFAFETIVVDNNSGDESAEMVRSEFPEVTLLHQKVNLGFCGGNNLGASLRRGEHVLFLNPDTVVHEGALQSLLDHARKNPDLAIIGPKLLNTDGTLQYSARHFPNAVAAMFRSTLLGKLFPKTKAVREYLMSDWDHNSERDVDWVSGAAMFVRKETLDKIGIFDPEFIMYCEDVDLCWRAHQSNLRVSYFPGSVITHHIGRSSDKAPNRMIKRFHQSMYVFYRKNQLVHSPQMARPFLKLMAMIGLTVRAGLYIAKNRLDYYLGTKNK